MDHGEIAVGDRNDQQASDTRPGEQRFHHDGTGDERAHHEADDGHRRYRRVGQRVPAHDLRPRHTLGARRADVGLAENLQHGAAGEAREDRRAADAQRGDRQHRVKPRILPPDGSQPSVTAKISTRMRPSTKLGMVKPATAAIITTRSTTLSR